MSKDDVLEGPAVVVRAPSDIWLTFGDLSEYAGLDVEYADILAAGDVSWCEDQIDVSDVRYVRADLYDKQAEEMEAVRHQADMTEHTWKILNSLLAKICDTVKGKSEGVLHSFHDLPELVKQQAEEIERLKAMLVEASDDLADWGGYAPEYFREKHKLCDDIRKYREAGGVTK